MENVTYKIDENSPKPIFEEIKYFDLQDIITGEKKRCEFEVLKHVIEQFTKKAFDENDKKIKMTINYSDPFGYNLYYDNVLLGKIIYCTYLSEDFSSNFSVNFIPEK